MNNEIDLISVYIENNCNLKCVWCYDQENKSSYLNFEDFYDFYNSVIKDHIKNIILIGGEPLLYNSIWELLDLLKENHIVIVTNGVLLSNNSLCSRLAAYDNISLSLSIKGYNQSSFVNTTGKDYFTKLCKAIDNIILFNLSVDYSYVFDHPISGYSLEQFIRFCQEHYINNLIISEIRPYIHPNNEKARIQGLKSEFEEFIYSLLKSQLSFMVKIQSPFCEYSPEFINTLMSKSLLISTCSVKKGGALVFNSNLELILCDSCYDIILGSYRSDFSNYLSLLDFFLSKETRDVYNLFKGCPNSKCINCNEWTCCGGGCLLNWR